MTPEQRTSSARLAAYARWARQDGIAGTAKARQTFIDSFEKKIDPEGLLPPKERRRRAESARKEHFIRMALRSAQVRAAKKAA